MCPQAHKKVSYKPSHPFTVEYIQASQMFVVMRSHSLLEDTATANAHTMYSPSNPCPWASQHTTSHTHFFSQQYIGLK
jgi:hypothetical protein